MLLAEYDYDTDIAVQRREAFDDGVMQGLSRGISQGRNEGIAIGEKVGEERGRNEAKLETAKTLLAFGDSIEKVSKVTGLSVEEIEKL